MSRVIPAAAVCVLATALAFAIRSLQQQNEQLMVEVNQIRQLLESPADRNRTMLADDSGEFLGSADAPLTMVEFTDLQCPFCSRFHTTVFEQIKREYIDTGKLRYVARDFPIESIHPLAIAASRAVRCAGEQSKYWEMRHTILVNNSGLKARSFLEFAGALVPDVAAFKNCVSDTPRVDPLWQRDRSDGVGAGISGTPAFVIGRSRSRGLEGVRLSGAKPYGVFEATFNQLLREGN